MVCLCRKQRKHAPNQFKELFDKHKLIQHKCNRYNPSRIHPATLVFLRVISLSFELPHLRCLSDVYLHKKQK
jgi:hypothetical protein